jgi:N-acetylmuramic acid 6-phosphate (MurNAc-6-P) etherase
MAEDMTSEQRDALQQIAQAAEFRIAKLEMSPGDILVVQVAAEKMSRCPPVAGTLQRMVPMGCLVIVISDEFDLKVLTKAELEERAAQKAG